MIVPPAILLSVANPHIASKIAKRLQSRRFLHSGLFPIWEGYLNGILIVILACDGDEQVQAASVRHLAHFYCLSAAVLVEPVTAVSEDLKPFDVVVGQRARHYFCPTALVGNMDLPDDLVFRGSQVREWMAAPAARSDDSLVAVLQARGGRVGSICSEFSPARQVVVGTSDRPLRGWRFCEFVRVRFGVDVADLGGYGFLESCRELEIPAAIIGIVTRDCSCHPIEQFSQRTLDRAVFQAGLCALARLTVR